MKSAFNVILMILMFVTAGLLVWVVIHLIRSHMKGAPSSPSFISSSTPGLSAPLGAPVMSALPPVNTFQPMLQPIGPGVQPVFAAGMPFASLGIAIGAKS